MKYILIAIAVVALCAPAFAQTGTNTTAKAFITFDGGTTDNAGVVNRADPTQYAAFSAWIGFTDLGAEGTTGASFMISVTPGVSSPASYVNLLPGDLAIGSFESGVTLASTECMPGPLVLMARIDLFYLGVPGAITILDHPEYARWITDCTQPNADYNEFCIWTHGGVAQDAAAGDMGCEGNVPVEDATWGSIKALYR
jgi:hypothetical protein